MRAGILLAAAALFGGSALAQPPAGTTSYVLLFSKALSQLMISGDPNSSAPGINLGAATPFASADGCTSSVREDGPISCFTQTSCSSHASEYPFCGMVLTGPPGLTIDDIAAFAPVPAGSTPGSSRLEAVPGLRGPEAVYEAQER